MLKGGMIYSMKPPLLHKQVINGKKTTVLNFDVIEDVMKTAEDALRESLAILKTINTPEAQAWVKKYSTFAK